MRIDTITIVPSCGSTAVSPDCSPGFQDPGVIVPSPATGAGRAGTACAAQTFTFAVIDLAQGKYSVTTNSPPLTLGPSSGSTALKQCIIDYTANVARTPAIDSNPAVPGLQTSQKAGVTGTDTGPTGPGSTGGGVGSASTTVNRSLPFITTAASGPITAGAGSLTDNATISGLVSPDAGATVEFRLYSPSDSTCSSVPVFTSSGRPITLNGATATATSAAFTPTSAGMYRWRALYSGDANNAAGQRCVQRRQRERHRDGDRRRARATSPGRHRLRRPEPAAR